MRKYKRNEFYIIMKISKTINKNLFNNVKWARNAITNILTQSIISLLSYDKNIIITTIQKTKIMFQTYFLFSSKILMNDVENFIYSTFVKKNNLITKKEIKKTIYKTIFNKISRINEITNRALRQLTRIALSQITFLFAKYIQKNV